MIFALNANIGDNKCGTINGKVGFIHYQQHCNIKMWIVTTSCRNILNEPVCYYKISNCQDNNTIYCMFYFFITIYCKNVVEMLSEYCQYIVSKFSRYSFVKKKWKELGVKREYVILDLPPDYAWYESGVEKEW